MSSCLRVKNGNVISFSATWFQASRSHSRLGFRLQLPLLQPMPEHWRVQQGAAFLVQGLTAMYGLRNKGNLRKQRQNARKGETVLVQSAAGGCGQFAMAICHAYEAKPIATVSSQEKVSYLQSRFPWLQESQIIIRDAPR